MNELYKTLYLLRRKYQFEGYIHVKVIPGAPQDMVSRIGFLADRVSVDLELPTAEGLKLLAPHKTRRRILEPMRQVQMLRQADQTWRRRDDMPQNAGLQQKMESF